MYSTVSGEHFRHNSVAYAPGTDLLVLLRNLLGSTQDSISDCNNKETKSMIRNWPFPITN